MTEYKLSRRMRKIVELTNEIYIRGEDRPSEEMIDEINNRSLEKKYLKILPKASRKILTSSFIIPVSSGVVTGYYFSNPHLTAMGLSPLIVYYHGGGWTFGNMEFYEAYLSHLAEVTGACILSIDYRLSPHFKFPIPVEDCYDALIWAAEGAKYWKIDPDRIFVAGDSAGGNLAAVVSILARDRKGPSLAGQILLYPITDGRLRTMSLEEHADTPMLNAKRLSFYIDTYAREPKDILSPAFSPLLAPDKTRLPPALIITAEIDPLMDDGCLYAMELEKAETEVKAFTAPGAFHGFMMYRYATGRLESECAIRQFVSGRNLKNIQFISEDVLKREAKSRHSILDEKDEKA